MAGALAIQGNIDPGMAGLALVYALDLTRFLKHGTAMASKSEADFNSVERIVQYLQVGSTHMVLRACGTVRCARTGQSGTSARHSARAASAREAS